MKSLYASPTLRLRYHVSKYTSATPCELRILVSPPVRRALFTDCLFRIKSFLINRHPKIRPLPLPLRPSSFPHLYPIPSPSPSPHRRRHHHRHCDFYYSHSSAFHPRAFVRDTSACLLAAKTTEIDISNKGTSSFACESAALRTHRRKPNLQYIAVAHSVQICPTF